MRKAMFLTPLALVICAAVALVAGDKPGEKKDHWAKMKAELSLSDSQVTQLQQKLDDFRPQAQALEEKHKALHNELEALEKSSPRDEQAIQAKHSELESVTREFHEKKIAIFRSVLTEEQFAKFDSMGKHEHEEHEKHEHHDMI